MAQFLGVFEAKGRGKFGNRLTNPLPDCFLSGDSPSSVRPRGTPFQNYLIGDTTSCDGLEQNCIYEKELLSDYEKILSRLKTAGKKSNIPEATQKNMAAAEADIQNGRAKVDKQKIATKTVCDEFKKCVSQANENLPNPICSYNPLWLAVLNSIVKLRLPYYQLKSTINQLKRQKWLNKLMVENQLHTPSDFMPLPTRRGSVATQQYAKKDTLRSHAYTEFSVWHGKQPRGGPFAGNQNSFYQGVTLKIILPNLNLWSFLCMYEQSKDDAVDGVSLGFDGDLDECKRYLESTLFKDPDDERKTRRDVMPITDLNTTAGRTAYYGPQHDGATYQDHMAQRRLRRAKKGGGKKGDTSGDDTLADAQDAWTTVFDLSIIEPSFVFPLSAFGTGTSTASMISDGRAKTKSNKGFAQSMKNFLKEAKFEGVVQIKFNVKGVELPMTLPFSLSATSFCRNACTVPLARDMSELTHTRPFYEVVLVSRRVVPNTYCKLLHLLFNLMCKRCPHLLFSLVQNYRKFQLLPPRTPVLPLSQRKNPHWG